MLDWAQENHGELDVYVAVAPVGADIEEALIEWWRKLAELAAAADDWEIMIADCWVDSGRVIGHVQNRDEPIGTDRGFRVSLTFDEFVERLHTSDDFDDTHYDLSVELEEFLAMSAERTDELAALNQRHPFQAFRAVDGSCDFEYGRI